MVGEFDERATRPGRSWRGGIQSAGRQGCRVKLTVEMRAENTKKAVRIAGKATAARAAEGPPKVVRREEKRWGGEKRVDVKLGKRLHLTDDLVRALGEDGSRYAISRTSRMKEAIKKVIYRSPSRLQLLGMREGVYAMSRLH